MLAANDLPDASKTLEADLTENYNWQLYLVAVIILYSTA